jgi:ATP-dependent RNA helicase HelY
LKLNMPEMPPARMLAALGSVNLLPAIVFMPTRRRCDEAAAEAALARRGVHDERRDARRELFREFAAAFPEVRGHKHQDVMIRGGVASHHAGHIPSWKLLIEKLMSAGLLDAIFATATVAAGVDFPARTVVISNVEARSSNGWRQLSASELQQMTGRAGRRGRDNVGFVVVAPGIHQDPQRVAELLSAPPDPLQSQFRATYTTFLNLLDAYTSFDRVREIAERSFAFRGTARKIVRLERDLEDYEREIERRLEDAGCKLPIAVARGLERLVSARQRLLETLPQTRAEVMLNWLDEMAVPGRVVGIGRNSRRLMIIMRRKGAQVIGMREDGRGSNITLDRVGRVYSKIYPLNEKSIIDSFNEVRIQGGELALKEPKLSEVRSDEDDALKVINDMIDDISGKNLQGEARNVCAEALWSVIEDAENIERTERRIEVLRSEIWSPFERRARVLDQFGYIDFKNQKVTPRGKWLADLHVDRPLLVGEAIEKRLFDNLDERHTASFVAALAADADRDYGEIELDDATVDTLARFEDVAYKVASAEWQQGLEPSEEINFTAAAAAGLWADGAEWSELVEETRAEEGDLVRMLSRTGEALLQIAGLKQSHPAAARIADRAAEVILREPVR